MSPDDGRREDELFDFLAALECGDLSSAAVQAAQAVILDHLGCALLGMTLPWTRAVRASVAGLHGPPGSDQSRVYGSDELVPARVAALVNGTATHGFDLDDLYFPAMTHPGCVINPATFAAACPAQASGPDLLVAVAVGYELMGRLGQAVGMTGGDRGLHMTGQQGPAAAGAAVMKLFGGDRGALASAAGLGVSMGGGTKAFQEGPGMIKRLHAGRAAEAGVLAADLVRLGFDGPRHALTSPFGFITVFGMGGPTDPGALDRDLGGRMVVENIYLKPYAACGALHGSLTAAEQLVARPGFDPAGVERVVVGASRRAVAQNNDPEPPDIMAAQYSMQYAVALALHGRSREAARFLDLGTPADESVRRLAARIDVVEDPRAEAAFPSSNEGRIQLQMKDGSELEEYGRCDDASSRGLVTATAKFRAVAGPLLTEPSVDAVIDAVGRLAHDGSAANCLDAVELRLTA